MQDIACNDVPFTWRGSGLLGMLNSYKYATVSRANSSRPQLNSSTAMNFFVALISTLSLAVAVMATPTPNPECAGRRG